MQSIATTVLEHAGWRVRLARSWRGLCHLSLADDRDELERHVRRHFEDAVVVDDAVALRGEAERVAAYLDGELRAFDLDLDLRGSDFQLRVWHAVRGVAYGRTATYGEIARAAGRPGGAHAVGQAVGHSPVALVVPCHRVVASGGRIGGYGGDVGTKRRLLALEGVPPLRD
jgi:O-6-methylguanine DNA methyltransferase